MRYYGTRAYRRVVGIRKSQQAAGYSTSDFLIKASAIAFGYDKVAFVIVPRTDLEAEIRSEFPVETFVAKDNYGRTTEYRLRHGGLNPPLEQTFGDVQQGLVKLGRVSDPEHGVYLLPEIVELAWQRINANEESIS